MGSIAKTVQEMHPNITLRIAYVGYRDYDQPAASRFEILPFADTACVSRLTTFLESVRAKGGGDSQEDVVGGLRQVTALEWRSSALQHDSAYARLPRLPVGAAPSHMLVQNTRLSAS